ncbi:MAG: winged helix-turn-helix transcriptional regulator [Acidimicrobiia bacterium]
MERRTRTYDHFCMLARALEQVGDRWTLLIVRDLLGGPRRFTDLMALLGGITPATLSRRLRELEAAGIVAVDRAPGRREVWYRLTPAGGDLAPAVRALFQWGFRHARRPPAPGETVHPEHLLRAVRTAIAAGPAPGGPLVWHIRCTDDGNYTLAFDGSAWTLTTRLEDADPDVEVTSTSDTLTRFLMAPPDERAHIPPGIELAGRPDDTDQLLRLLARFPANLG